AGIEDYQVIPPLLHHVCSVYSFVAIGHLNSAGQLFDHHVQLFLGNPYDPVTKESVTQIRGVR
ncbi:MAG: hypothetical protein KAR47_04830, partial [Planctomycetes bacterium]|nr:hypothetical protein [Planctomycetota bacterium]